MSVGQTLVLNEVGNVDKLKSLVEEIQSISNADYGAFDSLKIQEYANALSDLEPKQAALLLSTQGLSNAQIEQVLSAQKLTPELQYQTMLEAGLLSSKQKLTTAQIEENLQTVLGSDADVQATMSAMELKVATDAQGNSVAKLTKKNIEAAIASGKLTQEQALQLASMLGVDMAVKKQAASTLPKWIATLKLSAKAIWENITATVTWLATTPAGWATLVVSAITIATIAVIKHTKSLKDLQETAQDSKSAYDSTISEIKSLNDELKTTQDRIKKLQAKDSLTFTEEDELEKLKKTNSELERELRIKEAIAKTEGKKSADDANAAITKQSEKYNEHYKFGDKDTFMQYAENEYLYDQGDRIDAAQWNIDQAIQNNKELEDLYVKRKEIEDKYNNDASQFQNDSEWKANEKNIESKKAYIKTVEEQAATYIKALMDEDDALYDSNGNVIAGQEDLVNRLKALYGNYDDYNQGETYSDTFVKHLQDNGISEDAANEIKSQLSDDEIKKASELDILPYIDENATVESVREAIKKAQEEADKNPVETSVEFDDPTSLLTESEDKSQTATLADLQSEADLLSSIQKEMSETGTIGVDSMQKIIKQYPEAKAALADYMSGLISEEELFNKFKQVYEDDKEQYIKSLIAKNEKDEEFFEAVKTNNRSLFDTLGTMYGYDVQNWNNLEQAKLNISAQTLQKIAQLYKNFYQAMGVDNGVEYAIDVNKNTLGGTPEHSATNIFGKLYDKKKFDTVASEQNPEYSELLDNIDKVLADAENAKNSLGNAAYDYISSSIDLSWEGLGSDSSSSSGSGSGSDSSDKDNSKDYDLIERKIKKLESAISALDSTVSDTYTSWGNRNSALADELSSVSDEISLQQQAYEKYMDLADSVGLDGYYEDLIKNGAIDVITVDDESLQDQIDKFQDFYDKAQDCNDKIRDLNQNLKELQKTKFDNVVSQFEDISSSISHAVTMLDKYIDLADKHGYYASPELYQKQLEQYNNTLNTLTSERDTLQSKLQESVQSGLIEEGSETWNDMLQQIQSVNEEIVDTVVNIQEVGNSLRDLNFTIFERGQDNISNLVNEGQFYVDLLDKMNKDLYDDDGKITNEGLTVQGIHSENYAAYLKQADFYAKEISAIEAELANDPANTTLIDKKQEYIEAQRESVLAAYDEKNAIIDLIKDGYDKASDALSKLIDKRKEALEAEKDLHDYQKSIQEKSDKVTELEKQKAAYANDTSEEAKKQVQQIEVNLKDAQEDLAETEYDKYISDQEKLLDDLQTEYEDLINDRIDNIDKELGDVADAVNLNRDTIRSTLENLSQDTELPLTKAMRDVWNSATPVVDLNTTVQGIGSTVSGITLAINDIITRLNDLIAIMRGNLDSEINNYDDGSYNPNNSTPAPTPSYEPDPEPSYSYDESDDSDSGDDGNYDDLFVYKYYYPQPLDTEYSVVDRLKSNNIDASWDRRADYYEGIFGDEDYTGSDYQNIRMLDWLKEHGYAKGKKRGEYSTGYHLVGEEGNEFMITNGALREVGTEDTIFTADMAKNIADFSVDPTQYLSSHMPLPNVKPASIPNNVTSNVDTIEISLPNVTNYAEFKTQLMNDRGFKSYMSEATLGVALGHNELAANKYK